MILLTEHSNVSLKGQLYIFHSVLIEVLETNNELYCLRVYKLSNEMLWVFTNT